MTKLLMNGAREELRRVLSTISALGYSHYYNEAHLRMLRCTSARQLRILIIEARFMLASKSKLT